MSAGAALQVALAARLAAIGSVEVYDGAPARAAYPYVSLDAATERDWGHKSGDGREVMVSTTLWRDQPAALHGLADAVEAAVLGSSVVAGWQLVSIAQLRRRIVRDVAGPWAAAIDFRARLLKL